MLISLFSLFCFKCKAQSPSVNVKVHGTIAIVEQTCKLCKGYTWRSQPLVLGKYPASNILLSFATLISGSSISKVLLLFRHMGLKIYCARTFFYHQRNFISAGKFCNFWKFLGRNSGWIFDGYGKILI